MLPLACPSSLFQQNSFLQLRFPIFATNQMAAISEIQLFHVPGSGGGKTKPEIAPPSEVHFWQDLSLPPDSGCFQSFYTHKQDIISHH